MDDPISVIDVPVILALSAGSLAGAFSPDGVPPSFMIPD
jgi:hypothetical protein